jgi:RNA polymerase sigma-70 factor (ECF subfamily)
LNRLPTTRRSLLLRLADAGDRAAWGEFLEVYEQAIFRFARSRGLQPADAEDVTQRVLLAVANKVPAWNDKPERGRFGAWIFRVTRNLAAKAWHARRLHSASAGDSRTSQLLAEVTDSSDQGNTLFQAEYRKALFHWAAERVSDQVQEATWRAFWMTAVEGRDPATVAGELGVSTSTVYTAKCRMLMRIRGEIERFGDEFSMPDELE